jgi:hypothetical protein
MRVSRAKEGRNVRFAAARDAAEKMDRNVRPAERVGKIDVEGRL